MWSRMMILLKRGRRQPLDHHRWGSRLTEMPSEVRVKQDILTSNDCMKEYGINLQASHVVRIYAAFHEIFSNRMNF